MIFGINTTRDISKLSQISLAQRLVKLRITILKYHSWYLRQISLQIMLLPILIIYTKKLLNSDWLRDECSSSVTRGQTCNTSAKLVTRVQITMVSDWLKTQKKPLTTNQIRAVLGTKFKKMFMVFSRRRFN